jgi:hypothetical protein
LNWPAAFEPAPGAAHTDGMTKKTRAATSMQRIIFMAFMMDGAPEDRAITGTAVW